MNEFIRLTEQK